MTIKEEAICDHRTWIDVTDPTVREMKELSDRFNLNEHIVRDCMQPEHLPKYEFVDDVHFLILRFFAHAPQQQSATVQELTNKVALFYNNDFLVSIHKAEAPFLDAVRRKYVATNRCTSVTDVVTKIAWNALETFDDPANRLSEQIDFYEKHILLRNTGVDQMEKMYHIKREASLSQKILMLMQEPINHIYVQPGEETALQDVKDQHLKMQTLYNQAMDDVNNLLSLSLSFSAQKTNEVVKVLTLFSVFFMPLTFVVGIYGMNFEFMPELKQKWGYPAVLLLMAAIAGVIYFWFKRKGWL